MDEWGNPTTLAAELGLRWKKGPAIELLTWDQFWDLVENKYWENRVRLVGGFNVKRAG